MPLGHSFQVFGDWLMRLAPRYVRLPLVCLGSPMSDHCALSFDPSLDDAGRQKAFASMIDEILAHARATETDVIAVKDLPDRLAHDVDAVLAPRGFTRIPSLPIAVLDLPFGSEEEYIAGLRPSVRSDLRRKIRQAGPVRFEVSDTAAGLDDCVARLYAETRARSKADYGGFDTLSPGFVSSLLEAMAPNARLVTTWVDRKLAGFNVFLTQGERAVAYKIGLDGELARRHNLYFLNWLFMVRYCIAHRIRELEMGQTTYGLKLRLGCRLEPSWVCFRHRQNGWNQLFKLIGSRVSIARMDPELRNLGLADGARSLARA